MRRDPSILFNLFFFFFFPPFHIGDSSGVEKKGVWAKLLYTRLFCVYKDTRPLRSGGRHIKIYTVFKRMPIYEK